VSTKKLNVYTTKEEFLENEVRTLTHHIASMIDTMKVMSMNRQHMLEEIERMKSEAKASVLEEREACAKLAWTTPEPDDEYVPLRMAISDAIRARGQA
jgi:hypothetical protein